MKNLVAIGLTIVLFAVMSHLGWLWYQTALVGGLVNTASPLILAGLISIPAILLLVTISLTIKIWKK